MGARRDRASLVGGHLASSRTGGRDHAIMAFSGAFSIWLVRPLTSPDHSEMFARRTFCYARWPQRTFGT